MTSPSPDAGATDKPGISAMVDSVMRFVHGRPWLLALLGGTAAFAILLALGWFFLVSPYSSPPEFIYNQF